MDSDEDMSSDDEKPSKKPPKKAAQSKRITRGRHGNDTEMMSLDENDEASESEAELTDDNDEESD